jgi:hypothetical protein
MYTNSPPVFRQASLGQYVRPPVVSFMQFHSPFAIEPDTFCSREAIEALYAVVRLESPVASTTSSIRGASTN